MKTEVLSYECNRYGDSWITTGIKSQFITHTERLIYMSDYSVTHTKKSVSACAKINMFLFPGAVLCFPWEPLLQRVLGQTWPREVPASLVLMEPEEGGAGSHSQWRGTQGSTRCMGRPRASSTGVERISYTSQ